MMKMLLPALIAVTVVTGCVQRYKITLSNNSVITTRSKPRRDPATGMYNFKDALGRPAAVPDFKVKEIEPL